ncbi:MAG: GGDEF domain-containing protein [Agathobacter sp.]|nr:GGDEF domain-containing protein [Agathobacter sp.]
MNTSLIDTDLLQRLQNHFCNANDIYLACLDRDRNLLTASNDSEEVKQFFAEKLPQNAGKNLLNSVEISQVEAIVEETLPIPYLKLCSVITRVDGAITLVWVVAAVLEEQLGAQDEIPEYIHTTTEESFYRTIAFLEDVSKQLLIVKEHEHMAEEAMVQSKASEEKYKSQMYRSEVMTSVVRLLGSEDAFTKLADEIIQEVCKALEIEGGCLIRENADRTTLDVICEYSSNRNWNVGNKLHGQPKQMIPIFDGKPYMISSDSMMPEELEHFFAQYHMLAGVFQPIEINGHYNMYLCLYEFEKERTWTVEDIKFISDIKRVIQSIVSKRITKNSLAGSYASLEAILENLGCSIYVVDYDRKNVLYMNQKFKKMFVAGDVEERLKELFFKNPRPEREFGPREYYVTESGRWLDANQTQITWVDGRKVCLGTIYDITDKKLYQKKIESQISNDALTGIYNRMRCEKDLEKYIRDAELSGKEGAFLCIDLDDFQNINDGLGHQYGDALLKAIAHNFQRIVGIEDNCYRIGGDEFGVIVHDDAYKEMSRICKDLRAIFERPWFLKGEDYYCTMSMGVVCFPTDGNTVDDLIRKSDMALLTAKKKGKNRVEYYNEKVEDTSFYRLDLEKNMRRATLNACNEFEVYYQPIIDQDKPGSPCCGAEALVRWNSSELGFIPPTDFIPLAEYLGLINPIGEHVLYQAVKRCKYWNDCGHPEYKVNVNLSVIQLLQNDFVKKVKRVLDKTKINPKNVTLEVTESLAINDMERMKKILDQIKALGVKVALDDFGTGYSSLNHIREMPIDVIKIDRCFVENLSEDEFSGAFVKMVSELAKTIGVTVCVEGVEQKKQLEALKDMNVKLIQGYYYGKPMPVHEFEKMYL